MHVRGPGQRDSKARARGKGGDRRVDIPKHMASGRAASVVTLPDRARAVAGIAKLARYQKLDEFGCPKLAASPHRSGGRDRGGAREAASCPTPVRGSSRRDWPSPT
jgi:hypothetical protein